MLETQKIAAAAVAREPFPYFTVSNVLSAENLQKVRQSFPAIDKAGVFPLDELGYSGAFAELIDDIKSSELEEVMSQQFGVDLTDKPLMITVRGQCARRDGRIHTDSKDKIVTCLLYLNDPWAEDGGRLRLLRNGTDLDDVIAEVPPDGGTLVAFRRTDNSWHGHKPFEGQRRYIMFNWVQSQATLQKNIWRHTISSKLKRLGLPF